MKRILSLVIMLVYMASAIGVTYSLHYCGGKFKEVCFTADTEKNCCGEHETDGCCTDKTTTVKCKDSHAPASPTVFPDIVSYFVPITHFAAPIAKGKATRYQVYVANDTSPPPIQGVPLYLKIRVIRV